MIEKIKGKIEKIFLSIVGSESEVQEKLNQISLINSSEKTKSIIKRNKSLVFLVIFVCTISIFMGGKRYYEESFLIKQINSKQKINRDANVEKTINLKVFTKEKEKDTLKKEEIDVKVKPLSHIKNDKVKLNKDILEKEHVDYDEREIRNLIKEAEESNGKEISLPNKMKDGRVLIWEGEEDLSWLMSLPIGILAIFLIKKYKFYEISKLERKNRKSIQRELPNFINKLVLLLSTGIIFDRAFQLAVENRRNIQKNNNYFYEELANILYIHKANKEHIVELLYEFAKRSKVRELVRVVNIVWDNMSKGDKLADKLQLESELLWFSQKKDMEERGRLSEGKLIVPLLIMLIILVIITVAPAMIDI